MPNVLGSRTFAIPRATSAPGLQWVNSGGQFVVWKRSDGGIDGWYLSTYFAPPSGSIEALGLSPLMKASSPKFKPGTGSIGFTGLQLGSGISIFRPATGSIAFAGKTPTSAVPSKTFSPPTGSIGFTGLPAALSRKTFFQPAQGTITITGKQIGGWKVSWARMKIN